MALVNYESREVDLKIVYDGPFGAGKKTSVDCLHQQFSRTTDLQTFDDILFFQVLVDRQFPEYHRLQKYIPASFKVILSVYTTPPGYNEARKVVLDDVDGLVFVADSDMERCDDNLDSLEELRQILVEKNIEIKNIPFLLQYNKRDLSTFMPLLWMERILNDHDNPVPSFETVASEGIGVLPTFTGISMITLSRLSPNEVLQKSSSVAKAKHLYTSATLTQIIAVVNEIGNPLVPQLDFLREVSDEAYESYESGIAWLKNDVWEMALGAAAIDGKISRDEHNLLVGILIECRNFSTESAYEFAESFNTAEFLENFEPWQPKIFSLLQIQDELDGTSFAQEALKLWVRIATLVIKSDGITNEDEQKFLSTLINLN